MSTISPAWQVDALRNVGELSELPHNWDGYGSPPPSEGACEAAARLISLMESFPLAAPEIGPASGGTLQMEWACNRRELELHVLADQSVEYLRVVNGEPIEQGTVGISAPDVARHVTWLLFG